MCKRSVKLDTVQLFTRVIMVSMAFSLHRYVM